MNTMQIIFCELAGLFLEDRALAFEIMAVVIVAAILSQTYPSLALVSGAILLFGSVGALLTNVWRSRSR